MVIKKRRFITVLIIIMSFFLVAFLIFINTKPVLATPYVEILGGSNYYFKIKIESLLNPRQGGMVIEYAHMHDVSSNLYRVAGESIHTISDDEFLYYYVDGKLKNKVEQPSPQKDNAAPDFIDISLKSRGYKIRQGQILYYEKYRYKENNRNNYITFLFKDNTLQELQLGSKFSKFILEYISSDVPEYMFIK